MQKQENKIVKYSTLSVKKGKNEKMKDILNKKIKINGLGLFAISMAYIYSSIIIFLIGWIKFYISIPVLLLLMGIMWEYIKYKKKRVENVKPIYINVKTFLIVGIVACIIGWALGWTGQCKQTGDWNKHNGVLVDLVKKDWPVYYENNGERSMLTYYLGQYLVPSVVGKITKSVALAQFFNGIWAIIGLTIGILGIFKITKADTSEKQLRSLILIFSFSVCLSLSQVLGKLFIDGEKFEQGHWFSKESPFILQYSSNIILLRWVMPQCIIPWIIMSILYDDPYDIKHYVILCLPMMLYSTFAFVGLIIYLFIIVINSIIKNKEVKSTIFNIFSLSNILTVATIGVIFILYFIGNIMSDKPGDISFCFVNYGFSNILIYIFFIMSFIPYTFVLFKEYRKNIFYWISTGILMILPFFRMGLWNDLCMRTSIIPLYLYMIMSIKLINKKETKQRIKQLIIILFIIGSSSSFSEIIDILNNVSFKFNVTQDYTIEGNANRNLEIKADKKYNYFTYDIEKNIFYKCLARKKLY